MTPSKADRQEAASFYYRKLTGVLQDWIETGEDPQGRVEEDIRALAALLAKVRTEGSAAGELAERARRPKPEGAIVTLIETIDDLHKKLNAAEAKARDPVTPSP